MHLVRQRITTWIQNTRSTVILAGNHRAGGFQPFKNRRKDSAVRPRVVAHFQTPYLPPTPRLPAPPRSAAGSSTTLPASPQAPAGGGAARGTSTARAARRQC